jgi:hypothetical protein
MVWKSLFKKTDTAPNDTVEPTAPPAEQLPGASRNVPPHLAQAIERRNAGNGAPRRQLSPEQRRMEALNRQRTSILFDIEQGELAASSDNPWLDRIALLGEAMETVTQDTRAAQQVIPAPFAPLPSDPITIDAVEDDGEIATVAFTIGSEQFRYAEEPDWADRSRIVTRSELQRKQGNPAALVPGTVPEALRDDLIDHLTGSLFVFASELRDNMLDGDPQPEAPLLSDLAPPCPICGGWTDWRGTCQNCARRNARLMELKREERRLLDERASEAEERQRLIEGLPLARKRLHDVESEIQRAKTAT